MITFDCPVKLSRSVGESSTVKRRRGVMSKSSCEPLLLLDTSWRGRLAVLGVSMTEVRNCLLGLQSQAPPAFVGELALRLAKRVMSALGTAENVLRSPTVSSRCSVISVSSCSAGSSVAAWLWPLSGMLVRVSSRISWCMTLSSTSAVSFCISPITRVNPSLNRIVDSTGVFLGEIALCGERDLRGLAGGILEPVVGEVGALDIESWKSSSSEEEGGR